MILAVPMATLLTICFLEYGFHGLKPDVESEWVLHPAWWQSEFLADGGFYLWVFAAMASSPFERLLGSNIHWLWLFFQILIIAAVSLFVFYGARLFCNLLGLTTHSTEPSRHHSLTDR